MLDSDKCSMKTLVLIKQKQTVLRYYNIVHCIHAKKLTVLQPKHSVVAATENTYYKILNYLKEVFSQKVISIWQGKIAVCR